MSLRVHEQTAASSPATLRLVAIALLAALTVLSAYGSAFAQNVRSGQFSGQGRYDTSGTVSVAPGALTLHRNFAFDGAPDPKLAFGSGRRADRSTIFTPLRRNSGEQNYRVPANIDVSQYTHVWLWCERFSVPLGVARLR